MSEVKVNKISPRSGTDVALGDSGDTFTIPSGADLTIASGATLTNSGTATGFAGIAWQSVVTAATFTAVAGRGYPIDTSSNTCTVTLPASASVGDQIIFTDYARNWNTNALTINPNSLKYQGNTTPQPVYDTDGESIHIVYMDVTKGWVPLYDGAVTLETPQGYDAEYLIVAGGGAGASPGTNPGTSDGFGRGGGGAGGYRTNYGGVAIELKTGDVYTVTVGTGGATDDTGNGGGNSGTDSSIIGTGISLTSAGGGYGGTFYGSSAIVGAAGGSGGGAAEADGTTGGTGGAGDTPSTTPAQGYKGGDADKETGAGGGGSSAVGANNSDQTGGAGGAGTANSITGASVTYAGGGGGGGTWNGAGGSGGGGTGAGYSSPQVTAVQGTDGLGGGGGGGTYNGASGDEAGRDGGDGVVIIRVATSDYSGTTTGSPTVTTDSGDTIIKFTASGSYTA